MNKREWERRFLKGLKPLAGKERNEALEYYREIYGDKIDTGFSEEDILREFGEPEDCARKILEENGISVDHNAKKSRAQARKELGAKRKDNLSKHKKTILFSLLAVGIALLLLCIPSFTNVKLDQRTYAENTQNVIDSVAVDFSNASVNVYCEDSVESLTVEYPQAQTLRGKDTSKITVSDENGRLSIHERQIWFYNLCSIGSKSPKINVYLPTGRAYTLSLIVDNGTINLHGDFHNVKKIVLETDNGEIDTRDAQISCETEIRVDTDNGRILLGSISAHTLNASTDNGEIALTSGNVQSVATLDTDNGRIVVSGMFSANKFHAETDNGRIVVSGTLTANELYAETDNGEIQISGCVDAQTITLYVDVGEIVANLTGAQADYSISVENDVGNSNVYPQTGGTRTLNVATDVGDIRITFLG